MKAIAASILLLTCFYPQAHVFADAVEAPVGYLEVFSTTEQTQWGEGSTYYPHTGYRIYDANGHVVKWVENHATSIDETPEKVELAPGTYTVWAQSGREGYVTVPVTIKPVRLTRLHLE